jgi:hypothetical protein
VYLYDDRRYAQLERCIDQILVYTTQYDVRWEDETVLVLELRTNKDIGYYFANHINRCVFWLDPVDFYPYLLEVNTDWTISHVGEVLGCTC